MSKVAVIGDITTNEGDFDKYLAEIKKHAAASREEPGCEQFDVVIPWKSENRICFFEIYADRPSFNTHASTDRISAFAETTKPMIAERKITLCNMEDSGNA